MLKAKTCGNMSQTAGLFKSLWVCVWWAGGTYPSACPSHWGFGSQTCISSGTWVPWSIGQAPLSTPECEIPVSSGMVGLGSDSLWERGEGGRLNRVSGGCSPETGVGLLHSGKRMGHGALWLRALPGYPGNIRCLGILVSNLLRQSMLSESSYYSGSHLEMCPPSQPWGHGATSGDIFVSLPRRRDWGGELGCYWYLVARTFYNAQGSPPQQRTIWPQMSVLSQMRHRVLWWTNFLSLRRS